MNTTKTENGERTDGRRKTRRRRRRRRRKDRNKHCTNSLKLPDNITVEIFCKIPIKNLIQCKCVCKSWRQSLSDPKFTKSLYSRAPACVFCEDVGQRSMSYRDKHILVDVSLLSERKERVSIPNDMVLKLSHPNALYNCLHTKVIGSCNGFFCVQRFNRKTPIFNITNPITGESIPLPVEETMQTPRHFRFGFGFGFSAIDDVYKVVLFRTSRCHEGLEVIVLTVGSVFWRRIGKVNVKVKTEYGVLHDGFLHWICKSKRSGSLFIRAFDVATERFKDIPLPPYTFDDYNDEIESHIGVLKGSLSFTLCSTDTLSVWIMKEHGVAKSWTKELDIEGVSDLINGTLIPIVTRGRIYNHPPRRNLLQVLKFLDKGEVLLFDNVWNCFYSYTPATKNLLKVDGSFRVKVVAIVHVPSFFSPKDIIRNFISSKHPEEGVGTSSTIEVSDIKMPAWTTSVAGWGENDESELLEIPRGRPTPSLPLPVDLKYVSSATATSLIDMISRLDALLLRKCMAGKDEIQKLRKDNEDLRATARLQLERKLSLQKILYLMDLILMPFMSYLALRDMCRR